MAAISTRMPAIRVEYDKPTKSDPTARAIKHFTCPYAGKRFYMAKFKANKNPKVLKAAD